MQSDDCVMRRMLLEMLNKTEADDCNGPAANNTDATGHGSVDDDQNISLFLHRTQMVMQRDETGHNVYAYATPFIIGIGLVGNLLSLCVFTSRQLRKLSASLYLVALSTSDTIVLLSYVLFDWMRKGLPHWPGATALGVVNIQGVCQLFLFVSYAFRFISVYLIAVFTIERFIAVCRPLHRRSICTKSFAQKTIVSVHLLGAAISLYKPLVSAVIPVKSLIASNASSISSHTNLELEDEPMDANVEYMCAHLPEFTAVNTVLELVYGLSITIVPFAVITILNLLILKKLLQGDKRKNNNINTVLPRSKLRIELTITLLAISTSFIVLNLPYFVLWLKLHLRDDPWWKTDATTRNYLYISKTIFIINYSINFFVYCMTGSYYRGVIKRLICCRPEERTYLPSVPSNTTLKTDLKEMSSSFRLSSGVRLTPPLEMPALLAEYHMTDSKI